MFHTTNPLNSPLFFLLLFFFFLFLIYSYNNDNNCGLDLLIMEIFSLLILLKFIFSQSIVHLGRFILSMSLLTQFFFFLICFTIIEMIYWNWCIIKAASVMSLQNWGCTNQNLTSLISYKKICIIIIVIFWEEGCRILSRKLAIICL